MIKSNLLPNNSCDDSGTKPSNSSSFPMDGQTPYDGYKNLTQRHTVAHGVKYLNAG
ncbi:MAG: hypothetical protein GX800_10460 [Clostridiaceae bacterium]|nr:hypothetical protein [Clostridiaceae bacterium]